MTGSGWCSSDWPRPNEPRTACAKRSTTRTRGIAILLRISEANARQLVSRGQEAPRSRTLRRRQPTTSGWSTHSESPLNKVTWSVLEDLFAMSTAA